MFLIYDVICERRSSLMPPSLTRFINLIRLVSESGAFMYTVFSTRSLEQSIPQIYDSILQPLEHPSLPLRVINNIMLRR